MTGGPSAARVNVIQHRCRAEEVLYSCGWFGDNTLILATGPHPEFAGFGRSVLNLKEFNLSIAVPIKGLEIWKYGLRAPENTVDTGQNTITFDSWTEPNYSKGKQ